jgi:hypothetical protein
LVIRDEGKGDSIIIESEKDVNRIRSIALNIKKKFGRKIIISCDGKELQGGPNALDDVAYSMWLENASAGDDDDVSNG